MTLRLIQRVVARYYGLTRDELVSPIRRRRLAHPRMVAMTLCRELTNASFPRIGQAFGGKDHTTILSGIRRCAANPDLTVAVARLRPVVQTALSLAELDTLSMRVYTAQVQQSRWDDPQIQAVLPEPMPVPAVRPKRRTVLNAYGPRDLSGYRTDVPVPSALYP